MWRGVCLVLAVTLTILSFVPAHAAPSNDDFINATVVQSLPFDTVVDVTGATREADDPTASCKPTEAGAAVWFRYTSDRDRHLVVRAEGQDSFIVVFRGTEKTSLHEVGCLDTYKSGSMTVPLAADTIYHIAVGNYYENLDPHIALRLQEAPEFDVAVTALEVHAWEPTEGFGETVSVEAANVGGAAVAPEGTLFLEVYARPQTAGNCTIVASEAISLGIGETVSRTYKWRMPPGLGDSRLAPELRVQDAYDLDPANNHRELGYSSLVRGLGVGVGVQPLYPCS